MKELFFTILMIGLSTYLFSQDHHHASQPAHHSPKHFRVAVLIGHTSISNNSRKERMLIPSWSVDIEYWFNNKWGVGNHNDIELESFIVEYHDEELIERKFPVVTTIEVLYKPWRGFILQVGPGYEFEKDQNHMVFRYGLEYEFHLPNYWDLSPAIFYDTRIDAYDTWSIGLGVGKWF